MNAHSQNLFRHLVSDKTHWVFLLIDIDWFSTDIWFQIKDIGFWKSHSQNILRHPIYDKTHWVYDKTHWDFQKYPLG